MNPELQPRTPADEARFELLEHPELWPDDPAVQAELAELLELHLALHAHGPELAIAAESAETEAPQRRRTFRSSWFLAAAAAVMALAPSIYALQRSQVMRVRTARIEASAQARGQARLWAAFFEQSSDLIKRFEANPPVCNKDFEDRNEERMLALGLLEASRLLQGQNAPVAIREAESARTELHFWLTELSQEEGCLSPERAQELRRVASTQDLQGQAKRLSELLKGEGS